MNLDVAIELIAFASRSKLPATAPQMPRQAAERPAPISGEGVSSRPPGVARVGKLRLHGREVESLALLVHGFGQQGRARLDQAAELGP